VAVHGVFGVLGSATWFRPGSLTLHAAYGDAVSLADRRATAII
jgi:hypothetical protein